MSLARPMLRGPRIEFFAHEYERSHGKAPRGRGSWAFEVAAIDGADRGRPAKPEEILWANGSLGEAKKAVRARIAELYPQARSVELDVCP